MSYITAVSYHRPQTSAVDKTNAGMEWEASSNVPGGARTSPWTQQKRVWSLAKPVNMTWGVCESAVEGKGWRVGAAPSTTDKTNDARTDGTQHRCRVQFSFQLQRTDYRSGGCLCHTINDTVCWPLNDLQDHRRNYSCNKSPDCHNQKSKWTMDEAKAWVCSRNGHMVVV